MWWTARHRDVDGDHVGNAPATSVALAKYPPGAAAIAESNHEFGIGCGVIRSTQGHFHVLRYGTRDQQQVCVPGAGDEPDAESFEVVERIVQGMNLELAAVTGPGIDMANAKGPAQQCTNAFLKSVANTQTLICSGRCLSSDADRGDLAQGLQHSCG